MTPAARGTRWPRSIGLLAMLGLAAVVVLAVLLGLGTWQVHRLGWKLALIERVDGRVHAAPVEAPDAMAPFDPVEAEYRHVRVAGTLLADRSTLVQALTAYGAGFWVMTPLRRPDGSVVLINRGFVPSDKRDPAWAGGDDPRYITITGLLRLTEPNGAFLRRNDPVANRWFSRDVAAIAAAHGLDRVAPYFIDAEAGPPDTFPVGGLTVTTFPNSHLVYALTWYTLAAMLAGAVLWVGRAEWQVRHRQAG